MFVFDGAYPRGHATRDMQPGTCKREHATGNLQPGTCNRDMQPRTRNRAASATLATIRAAARGRDRGCKGQRRGHRKDQLKTIKSQAQGRLM